MLHCTKFCKSESHPISTHAPERWEAFLQRAAKGVDPTQDAFAEFHLMSLDGLQGPGAVVGDRLLPSALSRIRVARWTTNARKQTKVWARMHSGVRSPFRWPIRSCARLRCADVPDTLNSGELPSAAVCAV